MQINSNLNSMIQLEKKLEESASALSKLGTSDSDTSKQQEKDFTNKESSQNHETNNINIAEEMVQQIQIPIAYSVNANVISVQNATQETLLDIKA